MTVHRETFLVNVVIDYNTKYLEEVGIDQDDVTTECYDVLIEALNGLEDVNSAQAEITSFDVLVTESA